MPAGDLRQVCQIVGDPRQQKIASAQRPEGVILLRMPVGIIECSEPRERSLPLVLEEPKYLLDRSLSIVALIDPALRVDGGPRSTRILENQFDPRSKVFPFFIEQVPDHFDERPVVIVVSYSCSLIANSFDQSRDGGESTTQTSGRFDLRRHLWIHQDSPFNNCCNTSSADVPSTAWRISS